MSTETAEGSSTVLNWDDFRFALALEEYGTMSNAAKAVGTNVATLSRRIDRLTTKIGNQLFVRSDTAWHPTPVGLQIVEVARELQAILLATPLPNSTAESFDWDNLRFALSLSKAKTLRATSASLNTNVATVSRRIERFQSAFSSPIFERTGHNHKANPVLHPILEAAQLIQDRIENISRKLESPTQKSNYTPLRTAYDNGKLVRIPLGEQLEEPLDERAEQGWNALRNYLSEFAELRERITNQLPALARAFGGVERALGTDYDSINPVEIGMQAERLLKLSNRANDLLIEDDADDIAEFALQLSRYLPRFPAWQEYLRDAMDEDTERVKKALGDFRELAARLGQHNSVDASVQRSYDSLLEALEELPNDEKIALGGRLATLDVLLTVADKAREEANEAKTEGFFKEYSSELRDTRRKAIAKTQVVAEGALASGAFGVACDLLFYNARIVKSIAAHFPDEYQYILQVLAFLGL